MKYKLSNDNVSDYRQHFYDMTREYQNHLMNYDILRKSLYKKTIDFNLKDNKEERKKFLKLLDGDANFFHTLVTDKIIARPIKDSIVAIFIKDILNENINDAIKKLKSVEAEQKQNLGKRLEQHKATPIKKNPTRPGFFKDN